MVAILVLIARDTGFTARTMTVGGTAAAMTVVAALLVFAGPAPEPATPYQQALAGHLARTHAVMYGAYWCPHCQEQKAMFGAAAAALPYVECDPKGAGARPALCERAGVKVFPTWVIDDRVYEGTRSLEELARLSHFQAS